MDDKGFWDLVIQYAVEYKLFEIGISSFLMAWMSHGVVMFFGKMTEVVTYWKAKSIIAFVALSIFNTFYYGISKGLLFLDALQFTVIGLTVSLSIYALVFMRLFDRTDTLLDKKIGKDKENFRKTDGRKKKSTTRK